MRRFDTPDDLPTGASGEVAFCLEPEDKDLKDSKGRLYLCFGGDNWINLPGLADLTGTYEALQTVWDAFRTAINSSPVVTPL